MCCALVGIYNKLRILYILGVSVVLAIQHAKRMRRIILSSVACWLYNIFAHYLLSGTTLGGEKKLLNLKCVF
jgi:hypothetical protein